MKILALFQRQFKVEHLVSIHLPMYQLRGSSFRKMLWKLGTMQHWDIYIYIHIYIKRFDPSSLAHGICCCIKSGEKMWRFHLESQNMPKWGQGGEWVRVRMSGNVRKGWRECLFRLRVKGLQVTGVGAWEGALTPSVNGGKWSAVVIKPCKHESDAHGSQGKWAQACWEAVWVDSGEWVSGSVVESQVHLSNLGLFTHALDS